jgi:hypothetical protein
VSLQTSVALTKKYNVMINTEEFIGNTEYPMLYMGCCINQCHYNWVQLLIILTSLYIAWHEGLKLSLGSISMSRQCSSLSSLFIKFNTWPWTKNVMYYVAVMSVSKIECSLKYKFIADWCLTCQMWPDVIRQNVNHRKIHEFWHRNILF